VRISFTRNSAGAPEITGTNNYYPFGLNHIGGGKSPFTNYHSYKFGGKELQETGMYDFGARMYMPDLGRWGVIDPMAEAMRRYSPYNYAFNNPISFIDPDGMKPRQFAMPTDARPDAPSGWINPNWLGRGDAAFGSIDTGYNGGGGCAPMSAEGLLATAFNIGGTWNNTGFGLQNDTGTLLGYDGGYKSLNVNYGEGGIGDAVINIPEISLSGSSVFWGLQIQGHVNRYMAKWNAKSDFAWDRMKNSGRLNDHGVTFIGGAGDPAGIFDIAGQVMSTWKPENKYAAMAVGVAAALITRSPRVTGWLAYHEGPLLGHTIARHIGKTDADLINRLTTERRIAGASSFASESIAESVISSTINSNRGAIKTWINSGATTNLRLDYTGTVIIGRGIMRRVGVVNDLSNARIILKANGNGSYYILTAFPQ